MKLKCKRRNRMLKGKDDEFCFDCWCYYLPVEEAIKFEHRGQCIAKHCEEAEDGQR